MSRKIVVSVWLFLLVGSAAAVCGGLSCDKGLEPKPVKNYPVYFYDLIHNDGNWYFGYHPATNQLDSFWLPYASAPVISADGTKMYVSDREHTMITVVDLDSLDVIDQLPYGLAITASPDNQLIAVYENGVYILKTSDYSVVFHDTSLGGGVFSSNSQRFYGGISGGVYSLDLTDTSFSVTTMQIPWGFVMDLEPSKDETKLFLYIKRDPLTFLHFFAVYDIAEDSLVFIDTVWPGFGEVEVTPDGRYVFYTNPGTMLGPTPGPPWITVFDVERNMIDRHITTAGLLDEPYQYGMPLGEICMTPDGRWLVALPVKSFPFVFTVDVHRMNVCSYVKLGHSLLEGLACQNGR